MAAKTAAPTRSAFKDKEKPQQVCICLIFEFEIHVFQILFIFLQILFLFLQVRSSNMVAAKSVADAVRTSLGPKGMDKMIMVCIFCCYFCYSRLILCFSFVQAGNGEVTITNDGATILNQMSVMHPTAKMVSALVLINVVIVCILILSY
jgi:hypothetical protein